MIRIQYILFLSVLLLLNSCIAKFIPEIDEKKELLVVQGLITDQSETDTIKLSRSLPMGQINDARPVSGCIVKISDDLGNTYSLTEYKAGTYITDSANFRGVIGRSYTLLISTKRGNFNLHYESYPMEMKSVPPIDSIYYEKRVIQETYHGFYGEDACQIYLNTHDPMNNCRFYRWDFDETWVLRLLFPVPNMTCWISEKSHAINIKSTAAFNESSVSRLPVTYISNETDRLKREYSILVNQFSLNEDEYNYWEKIQNVIVQVGGLYDIIPASVPGNLHCIEIPGEKVLGYFSVSAKSSKRIFIKDQFAGIIDIYTDCISDTIYGDYDPPELYVSEWTLIDHPAGVGPRERVLSHRRECADCTTRGTNIKPVFWKDEK